MTDEHETLVVLDDDYSAERGIPIDLSFKRITLRQLQDSKPLEEWKSLIHFVPPSSCGSIMASDGNEWFDEVRTRLGKTLAVVQKVGSLVRAHRGRILVIWDEGSGSADAQTAISGGLASMVKALALDYAPHHIGINGLVIPNVRAGVRPRTLQACAEFLSTRTAEAMIGQIIVPGSATQSGSWKTW
ncbi:hypothetical protein [Rhizobium sp. CCGE 510]|uniref:hypothetical protein n=1 Tax=Rhizobium sp. CCGE 510 TaxID=1132836 RepID=UPI00027B8174|nr:hypothetical protein [Rhizobium sp. CCGE 510]EJT04251.1 hypothetical protein RCCGE510_15567 [Rhizobium sp. CCGE 510]